MLILVMMGVLMVLLLAFNWRLTTLSKDFSVDCVNFYDVNGTCPCQPTRSSSSLSNNIDFSKINLTSIDIPNS
jgi:hypothetical protein